MKYVIFRIKSEELGFTRIFPIIFPEYCTHSFIAQVVKVAIDVEHAASGKSDLLSAGFCTQVAGAWRCSHGSESLGTPKDETMNEADEIALNMLEAFQGILLNEDQ